MGGPLLYLLFFLPSILAADGSSACPDGQACLQVSLCNENDKTVNLRISTIHVKHKEGPPQENTCGTFVRLGFEPSISDKWKIHVTNTVEWDFEFYIIGNVPGTKTAATAIGIKLPKPSNGAQASAEVRGGKTFFNANQMNDYVMDLTSTEYDNFYDRLNLDGRAAYFRIGTERYRFEFSKEEFRKWHDDLSNTLKVCQDMPEGAKCSNLKTTNCNEIVKSKVRLRCTTEKRKIWVEMKDSLFLSKTVICKDGSWRIKEDDTTLDSKNVMCSEEDLYKVHSNPATQPSNITTTPEPKREEDFILEDIAETPSISKGGEGSSLTIGIVIGLLVVVIIAVVGIVYWRMSKQKKRKRGHKKGKKKGRKGKKRGSTEAGGETGTGTGTTGATGTGTTGSETTTGATGTEATSPYTGTATGTQTQTQTTEA